MKNKWCIIILTVWCMLAATFMQAQDSTKSYAITADSLATGNYKDVFKSFFQLAFDRFTSKNKEVQFTSNPFAIMARANPELLVDTSYVRYKALRNLNFSFSAKLDSAYKFNGFSSGITYAIINRRDVTVSEHFINDAVKANDEYNQLLTLLNLSLGRIPDLQRKNELNRQIESFFSADSTSFNQFSKLDPVLQGSIRKIADSIGAKTIIKLIDNNKKVHFGKLIKANFDSVKTDFQNRLLVTVGISDTTYKDDFMFSNVVLSSNLVKGITNPKRVCGLELNIKAAYQFLNDTLLAGRDLKRQAFIFEPGLNLTLKTKRTQYPWAEFKLSGSYVHLNRLYAGEKKDSLTFNGTLRIRVFNDIWIPLEIKYDPKGGNLFGFLNVRANFKAIRDLAGNKKS
ncbi:hypothetical protein HB364_29590 [Pseudoflavitalea sp. X16]|uniref:hypothetical protein n=1 Tax=Paraflavitalea devenefica TaxID=2716334 RepID=UPI00141F7D54|nr:hypothetical protein [Paraflavitalea devenefica]NII29269.1 hypothetical protein [Paraflavitalea devenefica]